MTDTIPDYAELIKKLEKVEPDTPGEGVTRYYRNPDGPEAAAAFRTLLERKKELERERDEARRQSDRFCAKYLAALSRAEAAEAERYQLKKRLAELETSVETLRRHALEWEGRAEAAEARMTKLEDLCNSLEAQAMGLAYDLKRAEDKLAEARKALEQIEQQLDYGQIDMALHIARRVLEGGE